MAPRYDFWCSECETVHEITKSIKDFEREEFCPEHGVKLLRKPPRGTSFSLKGQGWYRDGYGGKKGGGFDA